MGRPFPVQVAKGTGKQMEMIAWQIGHLSCPDQRTKQHKNKFGSVRDNPQDLTMRYSHSLQDVTVTPNLQDEMQTTSQQAKSSVGLGKTLPLSAL